MAKNKSKSKKWFIAILAADLETVGQMLDDGFNIETTNEGGMTAIMMAAGMSHPQLIELLLEHKANINEQTSRGHDALLFMLGESWGHSFPETDAADMDSALALVLKRGANLRLRHWQIAVLQFDRDLIATLVHVSKARPSHSDVSQIIQHTKAYPHEVNVDSDQLKQNLEALRHAAEHGSQ